jgi:CheY-like chemotaxis protein
MRERIVPSSPRELADLVRDALLHLYDHGYLLRHPLARMAAGTAGGGAEIRGKQLLQTLLDAIEAFRPGPGTPADSRAWRHFRLLELRYVGGVSAGDVIARLDISKSQYQRDHAGALEALAMLLWDRWQLGSPESEPAAAADSREALALSEANDLVIQMNPDYVDLGELLSELLALLQAVAVENRSTLVLDARPGPVRIHGDRVALRLTFLGLLNAALGRGLGGTVTVSVDCSEASVCVNLEAAPGKRQVSQSPAPIGNDPELEVSRRLVEAMGGEFAVETSDGSTAWRARVALRIAQRPVVLVVDNHPDFLDLVRRYLAETDWRVASARDVLQGQRLAVELRPHAIVLDVMMPGQDGWDLLLALKTRPETRLIPVIICSVLYEPQVARALGAMQYLAKPIRQSDLLAALAPLDPDKRGPALADLPRQR